MGCVDGACSPHTGPGGRVGGRFSLLSYVLGVKSFKFKPAFLVVLKAYLFFFKFMKCKSDVYSFPL